jgi:hypothetical protein
MLTGKTITLDVERSDSVEVLKMKVGCCSMLLLAVCRCVCCGSQIMDKTDIPMDQQRLIWAGNEVRGPVAAFVDQVCM